MTPEEDFEETASPEEKQPTGPILGETAEMYLTKLVHAAIRDTQKTFPGERGLNLMQLSGVLECVKFEVMYGAISRAAGKSQKS